MWDPSSPTRDRTSVFCIERWTLYHWTTREVPRIAFRLPVFLACDYKILTYTHRNQHSWSLPLRSHWLSYFLVFNFWSLYQTKNSPLLITANCPAGEMWDGGWRSETVDFGWIFLLDNKENLCWQPGCFCLNLHVCGPQAAGKSVWLTAWWSVQIFCHGRPRGHRSNAWPLGLTKATL